MIEVGKPVVCIKLPEQGWETNHGPKLGEVITVERVATVYNSLYLGFLIYGKRGYRSDFFRPCKDTSQQVSEFKKLLVPKKETV